MLARFPGCAHRQGEGRRAGTDPGRRRRPGQRRARADPDGPGGRQRRLEPSTRPSPRRTALTADGPLEYLEQPCATVAELAELRRRVATSRWPPTRASARPTTRCTWSRAGAADIAVLKVAPLGGISALLRDRRADRHPGRGVQRAGLGGRHRRRPDRRCGAADAAARLRAGHRRAVRRRRRRARRARRRLPAGRARDPRPGAAGRPLAAPTAVTGERGGSTRGQRPATPLHVLICGVHGVDDIASGANDDGMTRSVVLARLPGCPGAGPGRARSRCSLRRPWPLAADGKEGYDGGGVARRAAGCHRDRAGLHRRHCPTRVTPIDTLVLPGGSGAHAVRRRSARHRLDRRSGAACPPGGQRVHRSVPGRPGRPARRLPRHHALGVRRAAGPRIPGGRRRSRTRSSCAARERVWTAAGVTAGIDLALALVEDDHGTELAQTVARWLVLYLRRPGGQTQFAAPVWMPRAKREPIREVQEAIEAEPGGVHSICRAGPPAPR